MSDDTALGRIVLVIVLTAAFALLLYGAAGPSFPFAPATPVFVNPFDLRFRFDLPFNRDIAATGPASVTNTGPADPNCIPSPTQPSSAWFDCINSPDADMSFVTVNATRNQFRTGYQTVSGVPLGNPVMDVIITAQCRSGVGTDRTVDFIFYRGNNVTDLIADIQSFAMCGTTSFANYTVDGSFVRIRPTVNDLSGGHLNVVAFTGPPSNNSSPIDFSYIRLDFVAGTEPECTVTNALDYVGCTIQGFFNFLMRFGTLLLNIILYITGWVIAVVQTITNVLSVVVWLFAIPKMPLLFQLILDALLITAFGMLLLAIARVVRGSNA